MDSNKLHYFIVVSQTGSIRKAAELLRLSPAALSKSIKQLEAQLNVQLIAASGRGIIVTDAGVALARRAAPLLAELSGLADDVRQKNEAFQSLNKKLKLGTFEVFSSHFLENLLTNLADDYHVDLHELTPGKLEKALVERHVDFGITYIPIPTKGVIHKKITSIDMEVYGTGEFCRRHQGSFFAEVPFVVPIEPASGIPNKVRGLDGWPEGEVHRRIQYRVSLMESALEICRNHRAVAYLPKFVVKSHNLNVQQKAKLEAFPTPAKLKSKKQFVYLVTRDSDVEGAVQKKLAKGLRLGCKPR